MNRVYKITVSLALCQQRSRLQVLYHANTVKHKTLLTFAFTANQGVFCFFWWVKPFSPWPHVTLNHFKLAHACQINNLATGYCFDYSPGTLISSNAATFSHSRKVDSCAPTGQEKNAQLNLHNHLSEVVRVWGAISGICHTWARDKLPLIKYHCESLLFH